MRPIPRRLLIHTVAMRTPTGTDAWQGAAWSLPVTVACVRVEPCSTMRIGKDNIQVQLTALLYYDAVLSTPSGVAWTPGQEVVHNGTTYRVASAEPYYDERKLHHWEVGLA